MTTENSLNQTVQDLLQSQVSEGRQLGTQVCAYRHGERIIDTWAGQMGPDDRRPVQGDSLFSSYSTTKGVASTALHILADRGLLDFDQPVATYWPAFAANGKARITVAQAMSHQSGLHRAPEGVDLPFIQNWRGCVDWIAQATPAYPPGTATAYCAMTFAWIVGGLVEGASGRHIRDVIREAIAEPLGIADGIYVGIPDGVEDRLTTLTARRQAAPPNTSPPATPQPSDERELVGPRTPFDFNDMAMRKVCLPSGNGHFSARALARMYAALANGGEVDGVRLVSKTHIPSMYRLCTDAPDLVLGRRLRKGIGFVLGGLIDGRSSAQGPRLAAFGHPGAGGSLAFADPEVGLSIAVTLNQLQPQSIQGEGVAAEICELIRNELALDH